LRLGIDSYSFHRFFGDRRGAEATTERRFLRGPLDVIEFAARIGADSVSLQTCFLDRPSAATAATLGAAFGELEPIVAWGHPDGLAFGAAAAAALELEQWIEVAPVMGCRLVRLVAGNGGTDRGGRSLEFLAETLAGPVEAARESGVSLALENHADLTVEELEELMALVGDPILGVCLDTANALRVGDSPLAATIRLLPHLRMIHLKDVDGAPYDVAAGPRSVAYGTGVIPVGDIVTALGDAGFDGHVLVELGYLGPGAVDEETFVERCFDWLIGRRSMLQ
jgi:sugar phosphate isomerase/epimerase